MRRLRKEDGSIWSLGTLSRLFKVSPATIRCVYTGGCIYVVLETTYVHVYTVVVNLSEVFILSLCSRVAPASEERQREVGEEREMLRNMRRHKRKLYLLQRQEVSLSLYTHTGAVWCGIIIL